MLRAPDPAVHKRYNLLLAASERLLTLEIPPAAWSRFSFICCAGVPTVKFVYSYFRLRERLGWFEEYRDELCAPAVFAAPLHAALVSDWRRMWQDVGAAVTERAALAEVERHFPGSVWEIRFAAAKAEVSRMQRQVDLKMDAGEAWR
jgi:hypothetical protein